MKRIAISTVLGVVLAASLSSAALSGPITKQNGSAPVFSNFTSICAVPGYVDYGLCFGNPTAFTNVKGKVNAIQAKSGVWNLGISFENLQPGGTYRLWGNQTSGAPTSAGFFQIGTVVAAADGTARYSHQTSSPTDLAFDLNKIEGLDGFYGYTIVTSYWSNQKIQVLNPDGSLFVP